MTGHLRLAPRKRAGYGRVLQHALSAIRNLDEGGFDHLVIVLFDEDFGLKEIWRLPIDLVREHAVYRRHVNAHILQARGSVLSDPRAEQLHPSSQELGDPPCSSPFEQVVEQEAIVTNSLPTGLISDLERHEIEPPLDLAGMLDIVFRRGFGYALQGSPWRRPSPHEANVYRHGGSMTKRTGRTPAEALARALVDALDAEARLPGDQIVTGDG